MRYTEKKYDFKFDSPHDFVRILFCTTFLAPFRFFNEMSKKVIFLGKKSVKELINTGIIIAGLLFAGEAGYQIFFTKLSLFGGHIPLLAVAIAIITLVMLNKFIDTVQLEDMDIFEEVDTPAEVPEENPQPMTTIEVKEADIHTTGFDGEPTPITADFMNKSNDLVVEEPIINPIVSERLKKYDSIMKDDVKPKPSILDEVFAEEDEVTAEILNSTLNPINDEDLSRELSSNTKQMLGDNYDKEKSRFEDLVSQFGSPEELPQSLDMEILGGVEIEDEFNSEEFDLDSYFI